MSSFEYTGGKYSCDGVSLEKIAEEFGTPVYVYSEKTLTDNYTKLDNALSDVPHIICFSVKTNSNLSLLSHANGLGSGFDIVSGGELERVIRAGGPASRIVFAGVGKTQEELKFAIENDILMFNVESMPEAEAISKEAVAAGKDVNVAVRLNPDVDPNTHEYISTGKKETKFGMPITQAKEIFEQIGKMPNINPVGIHCHIGSQITEVEPYREALTRVASIIPDLRSAGSDIQYLNMGGGIGIIYDDETPFTADEFAGVIAPVVKELGVTLLLEPGRSMVGNAGVLVSRVVYIKETDAKKFAIVDSAMNDLMRPTLYSAYHKVTSVNETSNTPVEYDVVGPIWESGGFFAKGRELPELSAGDLIAVNSAGAYGFVMSSNYNTRPRPPEVWVSDGKTTLIRRRETLEDLLGPEMIGSLAKAGV